MRRDDDSDTAMADERMADDLIVRTDGEPWVKLATGTELASWSKEDEIRYNQGNRQAEK